MSNKRSRTDSGGGGGTATNAAGHGTPSSLLDTPSRAGTGLRHFSMRVCKKVQEKVTTSYNEVADELVAEFIEQRRTEIAEAGGDPDVELPPPRSKKAKSGDAATAPAAAKPPPGYTPTGMAKGYDEKNIRRRVYDALNVLMAMDIIEKEQKKITWKGLPNTAPHDLDVLQRERRMRLEDIREKQERLQSIPSCHLLALPCRTSGLALTRGAVAVPPQMLPDTAPRPPSSTRPPEPGRACVISP